MLFRSESLTARGWERAGALACFFSPSHGPLQNPNLAVPQHLFATKVGPNSLSKRPQETITPLSGKLNQLAINTTYLKNEHAEMAKVATACPGVVLICWEHHLIPAIANQLLGNSSTAPQQWPNDRFDLVWVFDWNAASQSYSFQQIPQCLLSGDSASTIPVPPAGAEELVVLEEVVAVDEVVSLGD